MHTSLLRKGLVFGIICLFIGINITPSINSIIEEKTSGENINFSGHENEEKCYGFAIPLINGENLPYTSIQQNIANLINDLLRLNISVFWASNNFFTQAVGFSDDLRENRFFEKGTYIVPITGNLSKDALLSVIINDYAYASEIETRDHVDVYYIMEPLFLDVFPLNYAKIAYHFGAGIHYYLLLCYLDSFQMGGFLDNDLLLDNDIAFDLNNNDFNVFIWPGANLGLGFMGWRGSIKTTLHLKASQKIRGFVEHGGGYIGSCYGKASASSGFLIPRNLVAHYFPNLSVTGHLALLPSCFSVNPGIGYITVKIVNMSHPVSFGLSQMQRSWRAHGPVDIWLGNDAQPLATLENFSFQWTGKDLAGVPYWIIENITKFEIGKPIWTTGRYVNGKIVVFGDHPEAPEPYRLDRLLHNSVFFTTADLKTSLNISKNISISKIKKFNTVTSNLSLNESSRIFTSLWTKIETLSEDCNNIDTIENNIMNIALELADEGKIDSTLKYKIATEYRESYQRWLTGFYEALEKLENIYSEVHAITNISSDIQSWQKNMNNSLEVCQRIFINAREMGYTMLQKLNNFTGQNRETFSIKLLADTRDNNYREGYKRIIVPWMSTEKISRRLWYEYERDLALTLNLENHSSIIPRADRDQQNLSIGMALRNIFVDDDATPNGNGSYEHPYRYIQDAIDAAFDQDTIYVSEGLYKETITIHKSITLIGENKATTIIDGEQKPHWVVTTTVPGIEIKGFTIRNSSKELTSVGLLLQDSNNIIQDTIFTDNRLALGLRPMAGNSIIKNNIFINNSYMGLVIDELDSRNITIINNTFIQNNQQGLYLANVLNTIVNNTFIDDGITFSQTNESLLPIMKNNSINKKPIYYLTNTKDIIISGDAGELILSNCENITIQNIQIENIDTAIFIIHSNNINIMNCALSNNLVGINIWYSNYLTIKNNYLCNNSWSGIWTWHSNNIDINHNTLTSNDDGLLIQSSKKLDIQNNNITKNTIGISFMLFSNMSTVATNNFINNIINSIDKNRNTYNNNYWDDWVGLQSNLLKFLPYYIKGRVLMNFDKNPAKEPYDIP